MNNTTEPAKGKPTEFRVIAEHHLIEDFRHTAPTRPAIFGTIADVPGHGRLMRWAIRGIAGPCYGFKRVDPADPAKTPEMLRAPIDEPQRVLDEIQQLNSSHVTRCRKMLPSAQECEVQKFKQEYPFICEALRLEKIRPARIFQPGDCWVPVAFDARAGEVAWDDHLARHLSGDFGSVGSYDPAVAMDPAALWVADMGPRHEKNSRAIVTGRGVVISLYPLADAPKPGLAVAARTVLGAPGCPVTLLRVVGAGFSTE